MIPLGGVGVVLGGPRVAVVVVVGVFFIQVALIVATVRRLMRALPRVWRKQVSRRESRARLGASVTAEAQVALILRWQWAYDDLDAGRADRHRGDGGDRPGSG